MKFITLFIILSPSLVFEHLAPQFIFWNVGQGQFTTLYNHQECYHFDFGGERFPVEVLDLCKNKKNILFLSHEDLDHYSFVKKLFYNIENICTLFHFQKFSILPFCTKPNSIKIILNSKFKDKNSSSKIFIWNNKFLFTGDATKKSEKNWAPQIPPSIRYWTVPHHGSKTSTSDFLIQHIPSVSMAIISARKSKYGHPHKQVLLRLQQKKIPALKTQDWGHIRVLLLKSYNL